MKIQNLSIIFFFILFIAACKKDQTQEESTINTYRGAIMMFDEGSQETGSSGVTVLMESSGTEIGRAVTDSKGEFGIPVSKTVNEFTVTFSKSGMGTYKEYYRVSGENQLQIFYIDKYTNRDWDKWQTCQLGSKSTVTINNLTAEIINGRLVINFDVASLASQGEKAVRVFALKELPAISVDNTNSEVYVTGSDAYAFGINWYVNTGHFSSTSCLSCLENCRRFKSGDKIYFAVMGESKYSNAYYDIRTGKLYLPNMNYRPNYSIASVTIP